MARTYKRGKIWYLDFSYNGRRKRKKVGTSKRVAELALKRIEVEIAEGEFGFLNSDVAIEVLIEKFLDYNQTNNRPTTTTRYKAIMDHLIEYLKQERPNVILLSQLTEEVITGYKSFRKRSWVSPNGMRIEPDKEIPDHSRKGARARTINLEVDGIKAMLNMAIRWDYIKANPLRLMKPLKEDDKKPIKPLTENECKELLDASTPEMRLIFYTFLNTGMRKAELENLLWSDIDFRRKVIQIKNKEDWKPKSGEREIPIGLNLRAALKEHKRKSKEVSSGDYVFKAKNSGHSHNRLRRELIKTVKKAGIDHLTKLHTLRHTFASYLVMGGVDLPSVKELMGHSSIQTTMIYAHLAPDHLADAVDTLPFG